MTQSPAIKLGQLLQGVTPTLRTHLPVEVGGFLVLSEKQDIPEVDLTRPCNFDTVVNGNQGVAAAVFHFAKVFIM